MKCHFEMVRSHPLLLARGALGCNYNPNLTYIREAEIQPEC